MVQILLVIYSFSPCSLSAISKEQSACLKAAVTWRYDSSLSSFIIDLDNWGNLQTSPTRSGINSKHSTRSSEHEASKPLPKGPQAHRSITHPSSSHIHGLWSLEIYQLRERGTTKIKPRGMVSEESTLTWGIPGTKHRHVKNRSADKSRTRPQFASHGRSSSKCKFWYWWLISCESEKNGGR